jgi:hypothetical protein
MSSVTNGIRKPRLSVRFENQKTAADLSHSPRAIIVFYRRRQLQGKMENRRDFPWGTGARKGSTYHQRKSQLTNFDKCQFRDEHQAQIMSQSEPGSS